MKYEYDVWEYTGIHEIIGYYAEIRTKKGEENGFSIITKSYKTKKKAHKAAKSICKKLGLELG